MQPTDSPPAHAPRTPIVIPERVAQRALSSYTLDASGCHVSTYSTPSHGYAQIGWQEPGAKRSTMTLCHRAAWVAVTGEQIPAGMTIDHICKNRRCVNPDHLRLLSNFENARRTSGRDWPLGQCINGHPNSELRMSGGKLRCRICAREWQRRYQSKQSKTKSRKDRTSKVRAASTPAARSPRPLKTHCQHGHEFTPDNTYSPPSRPNERWCRACTTAREKARIKRKRVVSEGTWRWETAAEAIARTAVF